MTLRRWPSMPFAEDEIGPTIHGPAVIARNTHAVAAIRYVNAHRQGLHLVIAARAQLDSRQPASTYEATLAALEQTDDWEPPPDYIGDLRLLITVDDVTGPATSARAESSMNGPYVMIEASYWIDRLPSDQHLILDTSWPMMGIAETHTTLTLDTLDDLDARVLSLRVK